MRVLRQLGAHLAAIKAGFRRNRAYAAILDAEVAEDIMADAAEVHRAAADLAYKAEQADLEAARLLRESLADGRIDLEEIPALQTALRHVTRSAASDHQITEQLA